MSPPVNKNPHWYYFTSCEFTYVVSLQEHSGKVEKLTLVSEGSEHAHVQLLRK